MEPTKFQQRMEMMRGAAATAWQVAGQETLSILADAERALKRADKRASVPAGFERVELVQHRGPTIEFTGRQIAAHDHETRGPDPMRVMFEIWETQGGALVAVTITAPAEREGFERIEASIIEPQDNAQAMRLAVMDHFDWNQGARTMARKLGWSIRVEVE